MSCCIVVKAVSYITHWVITSPSLNKEYCIVLYCTCVMLCYVMLYNIKYVITCVMLYCCEGCKLDNSLGYYVTFVK